MTWFVIYQRLMVYTRPYFKYLMIAITGMVFYAISNILLAILIKPLLDKEILVTDIQSSTWMFTFIFVGIFLLRGLGNFLSVYYMTYVNCRLIKNLIASALGHLLYLPASYFDQQSHGNILSKFTYNARELVELATNVITLLIRDSLTIVGLIAWLFYLNWILSLSILVILPLIIWFSHQSGMRMRKLSYRVQNAFADITAYLQEHIRDNLMIKISTAEKRKIQELEVLNEDFRHQSMRFAKVDALTTPLVMILSCLLIVITIHLAKTDMLVGAFTPGDIVSHMVTIFLLYGPLRRISRMNTSLQRGLAAAGGFFSILDEKQEKRSGKTLEHPLKGNINYNNVSLRYVDDSEYALNQVNLQIKAGQTIALVGISGSGKSSLINLLPRLYEPTHGTITIDGHDISDIKLEDLRSNIAYVGQHVTIVSGTIAENIAYGTDMTSKEEIIKVAHRVHAYEFIKKLPQGFDTFLQNNTLSGGQAQRIVIARALLRKSKILLFDEITSALDPVSELHIKMALQEVTQSITTIIIAHKLTLLDIADKIIILKDGRIVEQGTHHELSKGSAYYKRLFYET